MLIQIAQFLAALSLLIVLHELGHFIPAKLFKTRVEKFYLFFDYKFSLIKKKIGGTTYGIGWIPLGGYVKISGMVDESMDTENLSKDPEPWEFRAKPAWQRLIILTGGVIVNFILAIVIYAGMMAYYGETYVEAKNIVYGYDYSEELEQIGLRDGDKIVTIAGEAPTTYLQTKGALLVALNEEIVVDRQGVQHTFILADTILGDVFDGDDDKILEMITPRYPFVVDSVTVGETVANDMGLMKNDSVVSVNGELTLFDDQVTSALKASAGDSITLGFYREGSYMTATSIMDTSGVLGVFKALPWRFLTVSDTVYSGMDAVSAGWDKAIGTLGNYVKQIKVIFNPETGAVKKLGGFKTMMEQYDETGWNWQSFWSVTAFISVMLGFLNILPIPALDGGHVVFTLIEMFTGRKPSIKVLEYSQMIGFFLLLALLIYANLNDFGIWDSFRS